MASLTVYLPDQDPISYSLDGREQFYIGRNPDNDIRIDHASLSGSHALIYNSGGTFRIQDIDSTNGTYLDGEAVTDTAMGDGSTVVFGAIQAVFSGGNAAAYRDPAPAASYSGHGHGFAHESFVEVAQSSRKPAGFQNLSPIEKVKPKNTLVLFASIFGVIGLLAVGVLFFFATQIMSA